jgi:hypothetical protein
MASYFLLVKTFSRGKGSSATKAAAYRAGARIRDERSGAVFDYTDRADVAHAEIVLPAQFAGSVDMEWARNRSVLWNAVQQSGRLWNSRLAREVLVHLPPELTLAQRTALIRGFSRELADRYNSAVDFAIHVPRPRADQRHHHAHLLMTSRQVGPEGVGARTTLELSGTERHARGLGPSKDELLWTRGRWAEVANEALREAGVAARIDHRSYRDQGIDREPRAVIPQRILYAERRSGRGTPAGDDIRRRYRERVEARLKGSGELARVIQRQREEGRRQAVKWTERREVQKTIPNGALTTEQLKQKRRAWCKANAQEINRKQRERRRANAEEVNRKQREYARKRYAEQKAAKISLRVQEPRPAEVKARTLTSAEQKAAQRSFSVQEKQPAAVKARALTSPQRNARSRGQAWSSATAEESVKNWLAYREREERANSAQGAARGRSREHSGGRGGHRDRDDVAEKATGRDRKNDFTL